MFNTEIGSEPFFEVDASDSSSNATIPPPITDPSMAITQPEPTTPTAPSSTPSSSSNLNRFRSKRKSRADDVNELMAAFAASEEKASSLFVQVF